MIPWTETTANNFKCSEFFIFANCNEDKQTIDYKCKDWIRNVELGGDIGAIRKFLTPSFRIPRFSSQAIRKFLTPSFRIPRFSSQKKKPNRSARRKEKDIFEDVKTSIFTSIVYGTNKREKYF
jgi:hypothetical protein